MKWPGRNIANGLTVYSSTKEVRWIRTVPPLVWQ